MQCLHHWIKRTPVLGMAGLWRPWEGQIGGRIRNGIENRNNGIIAPTLQGKRVRVGKRKLRELGGEEC